MHGKRDNKTYVAEMGTPVVVPKVPVRGMS